jgi:hypothetical protein
MPFMQEVELMPFLNNDFCTYFRLELFMWGARSNKTNVQGGSNMTGTDCV